MSSTELCNKINTYLLSKDCAAVDYIFSTFVTDDYKDVVSKIIIKFFEDTLAIKINDASILEDTEIAENVLHIAQDIVKMRYLCSSIIDVTKELERSKTSILYTSDINALDSDKASEDNKDNQLSLPTIIIGGLIISAIFAYIFCVTFFADFIKTENVRFVDQTLGNFNAILQTIIVFFFSGNLRTRLLTRNKSNNATKNVDMNVKEDNNMNIPSNK